MAVPSILIAAPASGSGKTTITLALLRAYNRGNIRATSFKVGPDYIDPAFHTLASGEDCYNLDPWAMSTETLHHIGRRTTVESDLVIGEAVMGLFDGAQNGKGSSADLAEIFDIPIILVVDAKGQAASVGALLHGFNNFRPRTKIAGVIFNSVGSKNHSSMLGKAADEVGIPVLGYIPRSPDLVLRQRHLGLVQAREKSDLDAFLDRAADIIEANIDLEKLRSIASTFTTKDIQNTLQPPGQRLAIAQDDAFAFCYPHILADWRDAGAEITFFSPLNNEMPDSNADYIYLPGGYPELFAERLSNSDIFMSGMQNAAQNGVNIYGECGGFMMLGKSLTDADGNTYPMAGLLPVETSFEHPKLHLGYRNAALPQDSFLGKKGTKFKAHEFHYASVTHSENEAPLFAVSNAKEEPLGHAGLLRSNVAGSFIHLIDKVDDD